MTSDGQKTALAVCQYRVAFEVVIEAYEQMRRTGTIKQPQLASAALVDLDRMVTSIALAGLEKVRYDGSHVNELLRLSRELLGMMNSAAVEGRQDGAE